MKKFTVATFFLILISTSAIVFAEDKMSVEVREAIVRTTPNYLGGAAGKVSYGDEVVVISEEGNWVKITVPSGYLPKSSVTKHKVPKDPGQKYSSGSVKHDEVALAGKGFNPQVEAEYKRNNAGMAAAFVSVDKVERYGASEGELRAFQSAGKLKSK